MSNPQLYRVKWSDETVDLRDLDLDELDEISSMLDLDISYIQDDIDDGADHPPEWRQRALRALSVKTKQKDLALRLLETQAFKTAARAILNPDTFRKILGHQRVAQGQVMQESTMD